MLPSFDPDAIRERLTTLKRHSLVQLLLMLAGGVIFLSGFVTSAWSIVAWMAGAAEWVLANWAHVTLVVVGAVMFLTPLVMRGVGLVPGGNIRRRGLRLMGSFRFGSEASYWAQCCEWLDEATESAERSGDAGAADRLKNIADYIKRCTPDDHSDLIRTNVARAWRIYTESRRRTKKNAGRGPNRPG